MGKKNVNFNSGDETVKVEIKDGTYRMLHRGKYRLSNKRDIYNLLSSLEKFLPFTIRQVINLKNDWV